MARFAAEGGVRVRSLDVAIAINVVGLAVTPPAKAAPASPSGIVADEHVTGKPVSCATRSASDSNATSVPSALSDGRGWRARGALGTVARGLTGHADEVPALADRLAAYAADTH